MKTKNIILWAAALAVIFGLLICGIAYAIGFRTAERGETQTVAFPAEDVSRLNIFAEADDIVLRTTDTDRITVTYTDFSNLSHSANLSGGTLTVDGILTAKKHWYEYIHIGFTDFDRSQKILVELPRAFAADAIVDCRYGDIDVIGLNGTLTLDSACGDVTLRSGEYRSLDVRQAYGDVELAALRAESLRIDNQCGDVELEDCVLGTANIHNSLGDIDLDDCAADNLQIDNSCGDIECTLFGSETEYTITAHTALGDCNIPNRSGGSKTLTLETALGDIDVKFR